MKFSVGTANVFYKGNYVKVLGSLKDLEADVLCLQEVTTTSRYNPNFNMPEKVKQLGYSALFYETTLQKNGTTMGNAIVSKFPFIMEEVILIQEEDLNSPEQYIENRKFLRVSINLGKGRKPIMIDSGHSSPPSRDKLNFTEVKAKEDARLYDAVHKHTERFILAGDLNAVPDYPLIPKLLQIFNNASPDLALPTWSYVAVDETNAYDIGKDPQRVDYIFASRDLAVISTKFFDVDGSDHTGILTVFDV